MNKKKITQNKTLCVILMIVLVIASFLIGGMSSLNSRYEHILYYKDTSPVTYNRLASQYNSYLEKVPGKIISSVMPVKGPLALVSTNQTYDDGIDISYEMKPLGIFGTLILVFIGIKVIQALFSFKKF